MKGSQQISTTSKMFQKRSLKAVRSAQEESTSITSIQLKDTSELEPATVLVEITSNKS